MTTRLYFPYGSSTPLTNVAADSAWESATVNGKGKCAVAKADTGFSFYSRSKYTATQPYDVAVVQYISEPLAAQNIGGTVKGQFRVYEAPVDAQFSRALVIRVVSNDGFIVRGTLLSHFPASLASEWNTTPQNRSFPPAETALTEVVCQEGDRLVVEIGFRSFGTNGAVQYYGYFEVGDPVSKTDLPENETETGQKVGWLEFNQTLQWYPNPTVVASGGGGFKMGGGSSPVNVTPDIIEGSGGFEFSGEGVLTSIIPATEVIQAGEGGWEIGGGAEPITIRPGYSTTLITGSGGFKMGGEGILVLPKDSPLEPESILIVGSGGLAWSGEGILSSSIPTTTVIAGEGGWKFGEYRRPESTVLSVTTPSEEDVVATPQAGPAAYMWGGEGYLKVSYPEIMEVATGLTGGFLFGGQGTLLALTPQPLEIIGEGGAVMGGAGVLATEEADTETWALTGYQHGLSMFSGYDFNAFAVRGGRLYGSKKDGIYLLEGPNDAGAAIHTGVRIGPANFSTGAPKKVHTVNLGGYAGEAQVKVSNGNGKSCLCRKRLGDFQASNTVEGSELIIDVADFKELSYLEVVPLILWKR